MKTRIEGKLEQLEFQFWPLGFLFLDGFISLVQIRPVVIRPID